MAQTIIMHEDVHPLPYREFLTQSVGAALPPDSEVGGEALAYVNHGRWVVECPERCGFAVVASRSSPVFMCGKCRNAKAGGKLLRVAFPANREQIEYHLLKRPARHPLEATTRNWRPGEKISDLIRENAAHGVV